VTDLDRIGQLKTLAETPARLKAALKGVPRKPGDQANGWSIAGLGSVKNFGPFSVM
jgi:hypothetical protein